MREPTNHSYRGASIEEVSWLIDELDFDSLSDLSSIGDERKLGTLDGPRKLYMTPKALDKFDRLIQPLEHPRKGYSD